MPVNVVQSAKDEQRWEECKVSVRKAHPGIEKSNKKRFFAMVNGCLQARKGKK